MSYKDALKEQESQAAETETAQKEEGPNMKQILADRVNFPLYGTLLEEKGDTTLAKKIVERKKLNQEDYDKLEEYRDDFVKLLNETKKVKEVMETHDLFDSMVARSEGLKGLTKKMIGKEDIKRLIEKNMMLMSIKNPDHFENLMSSLGTVVKGFEKGEQTDELAQKYKLSGEEYGKILALTDRAERKTTLRDLVSSKMRFKRFRGPEIERRVLELDKDTIHNTLREIGTSLTMGGDVIALSLQDTPEMRDAMTAELYGEKLEGTDQATFAETKGMVMRKEEGAKAWEEQKKKINYDQITNPDQQTEARNDWINQEINQRMRGKTGFWAGISKIILKEILTRVSK